MRKETIIIILSIILLAIIFTTKSLELEEINYQISLQKIVWEERKTDTLIQPLIIFSCLIGASYLIGGEEWKF